MSKAREFSHQWVTSNGQLCKRCDYKIVIDTTGESRGGSRHIPNERTIYMDKKEITLTDAEFASRVWGIKCVVPAKK